MKAAIAGYSGLTGSFLREMLEKNSALAKIILVGRSKPADLSGKDEFLEQQFDKLDTITNKSIDSGFCLLGTTIRKAGSKEAFRKVDHDYVFQFARFCKNNGAKSFHLMSSVGADPSSSNFYLRTKGEVEESVKSLGFECLYIYRPSMLLGPRKEFRLGEVLGKLAMIPFVFLLFGSMRKYKAIHVKHVADSMLRDSLNPEKGVHIRSYDEMKR